MLAALTIAGIANATPLTNAVASYNASADDLQDSYDNFLAAQDDAYADFQSLCNNLGLYIIAGTGEDADDYWDAYLDAEIASSSSGSALETAFYSGLLPMLTETANRLQLVINIDAQSPKEAAYVSGTAWFDLPATPFLFWKDEGTPPMDEFVAFEFPLLTVGNPNFHSSYQDSTLSSAISSYIEAGEWIDLAEWFNKYKNAGHDMRTRRAADFDLLCQWCLCELQIIDDLLDERGYTNIMRTNFCNWYGDWCSDPISDQRKASAVYQGAIDEHDQRPKIREDLDKIEEIVEDYIQVAYYWSYPWE